MIRSYPNELWWKFNKGESGELFLQTVKKNVQLQAEIHISQALSENLELLIRSFFFL